MRVLGIDHGTKRIGLAISDETETIAQPLEFLAAQPAESLPGRIREIVTQRNVQEVIVGLPRNMDGGCGPAADKAQEFAEALRQVLAVPVVTWDERLTSVQANRVLIEGGMRREKRKGKVDSVAAAILLQSYLDRPRG